MAQFVAVGLLLDTLLQRLRKVYARLIGKADEHPQNVGHLLRRVVRFALLEALVAIASRHDARQFAHLLGKASHIGEFGEVAHAILLYPTVYRLLCFLDSHIA